MPFLEAAGRSMYITMTLPSISLEKASARADVCSTQGEGRGYNHILKIMKLRRALHFGVNMCIVVVTLD